MVYVSIVTIVWCLLPTAAVDVGSVELVVALNNAMEQWSYSYCDVIKAGALTIA